MRHFSWLLLLAASLSFGGNNSGWTNSGGSLTTQAKSIGVAAVAGSGGTLTISGTGFGTKTGTPYFEDFESVTVGQYTSGQSIGSLVTVNGGPQVVTSKSASGSRSLYNNFATADFPEVYKVLSGTNRRAYLSCKLWIEGAGLPHVWKFGRIGANSVYGGIPHAGASYPPTFTASSDAFNGEIVTSDGITSYWANNTANPANWAPAFANGFWRFYELEFDAGTVNNSDATFNEYVNAASTVIWQNRPYLTSANSALPTWFLTPFNGWDVSTGNAGYMDDIYIDESRARVVMTDNATYASSTKFEIQPVVSWSNTSIVVTKRGGSSFTAGNTYYLHVFDNAGSHNATVQSGTF